MADWRTMIEPAATELRRLRGEGKSVNEALDGMRNRGFTLPAVTEALKSVENMDSRAIKDLLDERGDWDDF